MKGEFRCDCPFTSALDILGDKWTLVIIKQMLFENRETFKDFLASDEAIATNILSSRLKMLEEFKLITKEKLPDNKKTNIYRLTEKGLSLIPLLIELAIWSDEQVREFNPIIQKTPLMDQMKTDKETVIKMVTDNYRAKLSEVS